jgi:hypothetical protein
MKVQAKNGRWYTRDHPHEIISAHVMRFEVIRAWLKEFSTNEEYGWYPGGLSGLERALGMSKASLINKLSIGWIWPREQVRLTARINDVLQGYIVPKRFGTRVDGVWTDPPLPPVVLSKPREIKFQVKNGALSFLAQDMSPPPKLPQFKDAFRNVSFWDPEKSPR